MVEHRFPAFLSQCVAPEFVSKARKQHRGDKKPLGRAEFPEEDLRVGQQDITAG